jgi:hypothetical protein
MVGVIVAFTLGLAAALMAIDRRRTTAASSAREDPRIHPSDSRSLAG